MKDASGTYHDTPCGWSILGHVATASSELDGYGGGPEPGLPMRYVALGDSYTIGTSVAPADRFPDRLVGALRATRIPLELVANLGIDGFTTSDLMRDGLPLLPGFDPQFVTLLIGVNDVVQGVPLERYEANAATILETLLSRLASARIVTIAVPDYTVTPAGADYGDPDDQHEGIVAVNAVMARLSAERDIAFVDIFDISRRAADDRSLVAADGLHPSGAQYALWVERIAPVVGRLLAD